MKLTETNGVVTDSKGVPAVKITASFQDKIGLPNYSSVTVGPISITRYVEDGDEEHIKEEIRNTARIVEDFLAEERQTVLDMVQEKVG